MKFLFVLVHCAAEMSGLCFYRLRIQSDFEKIGKTKLRTCGCGLSKLKCHCGLAIAD